jgi:hypothetical protein
MNLPESEPEQPRDSQSSGTARQLSATSRLSLPGLLIPIGIVVLIFGAAWYISTAHHLRAAKRDYDRAVEELRTTQLVEAHATNPNDRVRRGPDPRLEYRSRTASLDGWMALSLLVMLGGGALVGLGVIAAILLKLFAKPLP